MRTILISLIMIGIMEGLINDESRAKKSYAQSTVNWTSMPVIRTMPRFAEIDGSLFLAINTEQFLELEDGSVVEFYFPKNSNLKSFHVNDKQQTIVDRGEADILVMVHEELALALRSEKLSGIMVNQGNEVIDFTIDEFWQPHAFLSQVD